MESGSAPAGVLRALAVSAQDAGGNYTKREHDECGEEGRGREAAYNYEWSGEEEHRRERSPPPAGTRERRPVSLSEPFVHGTSISRGAELEDEQGANEDDERPDVFHGLTLA